MDISPFAKAQYDKVTCKIPCHTEHSFCHTEHSEVSINLKCVLNSLDFFAAATPCNPLGRFALAHSTQNDKGALSLRALIKL